MTGPAPGRGARLRELAAFHVLLFTWPLLGFLWRRLYPLASQESLLLLSAALLAGVLPALLL